MWMTNQAPKVSKYQVVSTLNLTSNNIQCNLILIYSSLRTSIACVFLLKTEPILIPNLRQNDSVLNTSAVPLMLHETSVQHLSIKSSFLKTYLVYQTQDISARSWYRNNAKLTHVLIRDHLDESLWSESEWTQKAIVHLNYCINISLLIKKYYWIWYRIKFKKIWFVIIRIVNLSTHVLTIWQISSFFLQGWHFVWLRNSCPVVSGNKKSF